MLERPIMGFTSLNTYERRMSMNLGTVAIIHNNGNVEVHGNNTELMMSVVNNEILRQRDIERQKYKTTRERMEMYKMRNDKAIEERIAGYYNDIYRKRNVWERMKDNFSWIIACTISLCEYLGFIECVNDKEE